ncbi:protein MMS22-like isoform X2 [Paramacrobiotus metropolitanus]|uniref:protein MMS22-like isoform X2 n=1 Tax=Paramacrobiotus metropolitanus TaxID=2943436 RepID=UPI0024459BE4|nr:protein MMS22-like isoform X2 [Paramacrobiotus metropolitanus]
MASSCPLSLFGCEPKEWAALEPEDSFLMFLVKKLNSEPDDLYVHMPLVEHSSVVGISVRNRFLGLRKKINEMRRHQPFPASFQDNSCSLASDTRRSLSVFVCQIIRMVTAMKGDAGDSRIILRVVRDSWMFIRGILLQFGYLGDDSSYRSMDHDQRYVDNNTHRIRYHAHLEMITLAVLYVSEIQRNFPYEIMQLDRDVICAENVENPTSLPADIVGFSFRNIVGLAAERFSQFSASNWLQKLMLQPYVCSCPSNCILILQQIISRCPGMQAGETCLPDTIRKTVESFKKHSPKNSQELLRSDVVVMRSSPNVADDVNGFVLWMLYHMAEASRRSHQPNGIFAANMTFDKFVANKIVQPALANLEHSWNESRARFVLACIYRFQTVDSAQLESLAILADFFLKNINNSFSLEPGSIDSIQVLHKNAAEWVAKWASFGLAEADPAVISRNESSFEMFIRVLVYALTKSSDSWKRLRGRFLSKFQPKYFESLTAAGWSRFFDLIMVLVGRIGNVADFSSQLIEAIGENTWHLKTVRVDPGLIGSLWSWIIMYFDAVECLFCCKPESLAAVAHMVNSGFTDLCQVTLDETKQGKLFATIQLLFDLYSQIFPNWKSDLKSSAARYHLSFLNSLFANILPAVRRMATDRNQKLWESIPICAVHLTVFSVDVARQSSSDSTSGLFQTFGLADDVHPDITVYYLAEILSVPDVMGVLTKDQWTSPKIIHSWVRCVFEMGEHNQAVLQLSQKIQLLPETELLISPPCAPGDIFRRFIEGCGNSFRRATAYDTKMVWQRQFQIYFADVAKYVGSTLRSGASTQLISATIGTVAQFLLHCAPFLYVRAKLNNTFRQLVDIVLLGADHGAVIQAVQQEFSFYFSAISQLNLKDDPQIADLLQRIIRTYLTKFSFVALEQHPLLLAMQKPPVNQEIVLFSINSICRAFFNAVTPPQHISLALNLITKLLLAFPESDMQLDVANCVFSNSLEMYLKGNEAVAQGCFSLIQKTLNWFAANRTETTKVSLTQVVRSKFLANANTQPGSLLTILDLIARTYPELLCEILPFLTQMFARSSNYPAYQTAKARQSYISVLEKLGPLGASELAKLSFVNQ